MATLNIKFKRTRDTKYKLVFSEISPEGKVITERFDKRAKVGDFYISKDALPSSPSEIHVSITY